MQVFEFCLYLQNVWWKSSVWGTNISRLVGTFSILCSSSPVSSVLLWKTWWKTSQFHQLCLELLESAESVVSSGKTKVLTEHTIYSKETWFSGNEHHKITLNNIPKKELIRTKIVWIEYFLKLNMSRKFQLKGWPSVLSRESPSFFEKEKVFGTTFHVWLVTTSSFL